MTPEERRHMEALQRTNEALVRLLAETALAYGREIKAVRQHSRTLWWVCVVLLVTVGVSAALQVLR